MEPELTYSQYLCHFGNMTFFTPRFELDIPLYRYRGNIDNIVDEIQNDHIFMSPLSLLNDPFDSSCGVTFDDACKIKKSLSLYHLSSHFLSDRSWYQPFTSYIETIDDTDVTLDEYSIKASAFAKGYGENIDPQLISRVYYEKCFSKPMQKNVYGTVASFSENWQSIPMWSYYANSHQGVCMKYDFGLLDRDNDENNHIRTALHKVWYSEQRFRDSRGTFTPFVKSLQWAHEQEWRLFRESDEKYVHILCLSEIYLGLNFQYEQVDRIVDAIKRNGRDIKLFQLHPKPENYGFERIRLNI